MRTYRKFNTVENYNCEDYLRQVTVIFHAFVMKRKKFSSMILVSKATELCMQKETNQCQKIMSLVLNN